MMMSLSSLIRSSQVQMIRRYQSPLPRPQQQQPHSRTQSWNSNRCFHLLLLSICLLLTSSSSTHLLLDGVTASSLPSPLLATWTRLGQEAASPADGIPIARCDHAFHKMTGQATRKNKAVPFPGGVQPTTDPYARTMWLYGGHQDDQYNDTWILDLKTPTPTWTQIHYPANDGTAHPRWGFGVAFIPNGLVNGETGLTGLMFGQLQNPQADQHFYPIPLLIFLSLVDDFVLILGGYNNDEYLGDVSTLNFGDSTQTEIVPSAAAGSDTQPFARGYVEWVALPGGAGSNGPIDTTVDEGVYYMAGGNGASNGIRYSDFDHDWNDEWLFSLATNSWTRLGSSVCIRNTTTCTDAAPLTDILSGFGTDSNLTLSLTTPLRPSQVYPMVQNLLTSISNEHLQSTTLQDVPNACTTSCAEYQVDTQRYIDGKPRPRMEGARMGVLGENLYLFGGYECNANGVMTTGGNDCYLNNMYVMNISTLVWRVIYPPTDPDWAPYWPSPRAYHSMAIHESRGLVFIEGGAYQDVSGSYYYYNDVFAFDVKLEKFVPFTIRGVPPPIHWSAGFQAEGDDLILFGGCQGVEFYDELMALKLDLYIRAQHCYASGCGLSSAVAGEIAYFYVQTRESSYVHNATTNTTSLVFGANATYGTGLSFSAQLVTGSSGSLTLVQSKVVELGDGLYQFSYLATSGSEFQLFIYYEDTQIPNSPFTMNLQPQSVVSPLTSEATGYGTSLTVKGSASSITVQLRDQFYNNFQNNEWMTSNSTTLTLANFSGQIIQASDASSVTPVQFTSLTNNGDGSFTLTYDVPSNTKDYLLSVSLNSMELYQSPYSVTALDPIVLPSALVSAFWFLTCLNIFVCLLSMLAVMVYRNESVMRSSSPNFLQLLIFGSILSSLSVIFLIVDQTNSTCQAFHSCLSIGLVMSMAALLAKSHRVARIFNAKHLKVQTGNSDSQLFIPTAVVILLMVLLNLLWIGINPMEAVWRPSSKSDEAAVLSFLTCSGQNGNAWLGTMLAFCGGVLLYGVYLAVQTGHVPEQFNESKVIAGATYNIFICCIIVVPLLFFIGSSSQFLVGRVVIESLVILWCSLFTVIALIGPKILVLLKISTVRHLGAQNVSAAGTAINHSSAGDEAGGASPRPRPYPVPAQHVKIHPAAQEAEILKSSSTGSSGRVKRGGGHSNGTLGGGGGSGFHLTVNRQSMGALSPNGSIIGHSVYSPSPSPRKIFPDPQSREASILGQHTHAEAAATGVTPRPTNSSSDGPPIAVPEATPVIQVHPHVTPIFDPPVSPSAIVGGSTIVTVVSTADTIVTHHSNSSSTGKQQAWSEQPTQ